MPPSRNIEANSRILFGICLFYVFVFAWQYSSDPLALSPQLDARENLDLANQFQQNSPMKEPFYRAVLYPYILSWMGPQASLPFAALLLGLACHLINACLVYKLSFSVWRGSYAALAAFALYLLNPASLFYAHQVLDITLATSLFLGGVLLAVQNPRRVPTHLISGLLLGLSVLVRPHFLLVALGMPLFMIVQRKSHGMHVLMLWIPVAVVLFVQGFFNLSNSGDFRILPWQGAYNLWAANKPGANGLHFRQAIDLSQRGDASNPARVESVYLYGRAHPEDQPPYSIEAMNAHWRGQFLDRLVESPLELARLWAFKAYAVVNSFEQYNNLTFSFHKERLPLLRYNPLSWGVVFVLGTLGLFQLGRTDPRRTMAWLFLMLAYASMLILFYASARFRLPLVPLMAILAGGCIDWFRGIAYDRARLLQTTALTIVIGGITFSSFAGIRSTDTNIQDRLLMANANADLSRDREAARWARDVLAESPGRAEALKIYALSYFNMRLEEEPATDEFGKWNDHAGWLQLPATQDPATAAVFACYLWHWDRKKDARNIWQQISRNDSSPTSLARMILSMLTKETGDLTPQEQALHRLLNEN